jgi:hypothetical protein
MYLPPQVSKKRSFIYLGIWIVGAFVGLAYQQGKDIVFRLIIEYSSLMDFGP